MIAPDTTVRGRPAHSACIANHNSTIASRLDHGDCGDSRCCLSERYDGPPDPRAALAQDLKDAWLDLTREERAKRLGQPLTEREDGMCIRYSHDDGVNGSGLYGHIEPGMASMRAALAALRGEATS